MQLGLGEVEKLLKEEWHMHLYILFQRTEKKGNSTVKLCFCFLSYVIYLSN